MSDQKDFDNVLQIQNDLKLKITSLFTLRGVILHL